jgi:uncharacterized protein (DUF1800 family)
VMAAFWDNHFNTDLASHGVVDWEVAENRAIRAHALGNFRTLLGVSAKSPAMLYFLDNADSVARDPTNPTGPGPNENYARELMELHTLGVTGGYTERDVLEAARALTGWTESNGSFVFNPAVHDVGQKEVLGTVIPAGGGVADGEKVLDLVAYHPSTANFVCGKLVVLLVDDSAPAAIVGTCAQVFRSASNAPDQIAQAVASIVGHSQFHAPMYRRAKVKTPLEHVAAIARNFGTATEARDLAPRLALLGMRLFGNPVPTGYPEMATGWVDPSALLERVNFVDWASFNSPGGGRTSVDPWVLVHANGLSTSGAIVDYFLRLAVGTDYTAVERAKALEVVGPTFNVYAADADYRLRTLLATILSFPSYQFQ